MLVKQPLESKKVILFPLGEEHLEALFLAGQHPQLWQWVFFNYTKTLETLTDWYTTSAQFNKNEQIVFAIIEKNSHQVVGTTRLFSLDKTNLSAEIGHTFITPKWQRTHVNSHVKYLLLNYAFETLKLNRVAINTHESNQQSRAAITRLGARFEGIAYKHRVLPNGSTRNTAMFSIIDEQWATIKDQLQEKF